MEKDNKNKEPSGQKAIAFTVLIFSGSIVVVIAGIAILVDAKTNIMPVFNVVLPLVASWVGTVLAFYFGRENFESANKQVRELVQRFAPEQEAAQPVTTAMRFLPDMTCKILAKDVDETKITVKELRKFIKDNKVSRLPVLSADKKPKYMLHESSFDKFLTIAGKTEDDTLEIFLAEMKAQFKMEFGLDNGFVIVSVKATLAEGKKKMDAIQFCQDIFVTENGTPDEPLKGWISNLRLARYTEV